jgi:hypothetical protein
MNNSTASTSHSKHLIVAPGGLVSGGRHVESWTSVPPPNRQLSQADTKKMLLSLPNVDLKGSPLHIQAIFDLSGSMWGGNDALGLRFEVLLVAVQKLLSGFGRKGRRGPKLTVEVISFDLTSRIELAPTLIDRRSFATLEAALLSASLGGSSNLGPALAHGESTRTSPCLRVIMTDFELFDPDPGAVLASAASSTVEHTVALSFRGRPPAALVGDRMSLHHIDPTHAERGVVAEHVIAGAEALAAKLVTR